MMNFRELNSFLVAICMLLLASLANGQDFKINIFFPGDVGIDNMLKSSIASVPSPDFSLVYVAVDAQTWADSTALADLLINNQKTSPADGFFLACKNTDLGKIGVQFRESFPKIPFVDTFMPSMLAANIISFRYMVLAGTSTNQAMAISFVEGLGIEDHLMAGSGFWRYLPMVEMAPFQLTTLKSGAIPDIVNFGQAATGSSRTNISVLNIEAIALVGCEGFLDIGVATGAQADLVAQKVPLQVINPIKASMGLLYSMIRNKVWISSRIFPQ